MRDPRACWMEVDRPAEAGLEVTKNGRYGDGNGEPAQVQSHVVCEHGATAWYLVETPLPLYGQQAWEP